MRKIFIFFTFFLMLAACGNPDSQNASEELVTTDEQSSVNAPLEEQPLDVTYDEPTHATPEPAPVITIPILDIPKRDIPDTEALRFTAAMMNGWNLGNTFDAYGSWYTGPVEDYESIWVGVKTTKEMFDAVKAAGFNTIRIPVTWHPHVDEEFNIADYWLARVKEVVDYAWDNDMFVILNIHHDDNKAYIYPDSEHFESSALYVRRIWEQVAPVFAEYDERLIFESMNEPRLVGTQYEWWWPDYNDEVIDAIDTICKLNQVFTDTVRASGGYNAERYLMLPGLCANPDSVTSGYFRLPDDTAENKLIISVHAYTPYNFALQGMNESGSTAEFKTDNTNSTRDIDSFLNKLYDTYISQGIPVVIGEFGARDKGGNTQSRVNFTAYYSWTARAVGIPVMWWDNHGVSGDGELFALLDRNNLTWLFPEIVEVLVRE